jgi:predicted HicB family RNase H-like nuclease
MATPAASQQRELRSEQLTIRVAPHVKLVAERIAAREDRSLSQLLSQVLAAWAKTVSEAA